MNDHQPEDLPNDWACERCGNIVPMLDTAIVSESLEIICPACEQTRVGEQN